MTQNKRKYKYLEIKDFLLNGIYSGRFKVGGMLPTERELARQFHVNRLTVTKALKEIEEMDLIERIQGSGSYVRLSNSGIFSVEMRSFTEKYKSSDKIIKTKVVYYSLKKCRDTDVSSLSKKLLIKSNDDIHYFRRIHLLNERPICVQDLYVPANRIPIVSLDSLNGSFYRYMENELKLELGEGMTHVSAFIPNEEILKVLEIKVKEPVISSQHTVMMKKGLPIEYSVLYYNYRYYFLDYSNKRTYK